MSSEAFLNNLENLSAEAEPGAMPPYTGNFYDPFQSAAPRDKLTTLEEPALVEAAQGGDKEAAARFVANSLRLIPWLLTHGEHAPRYSGMARANHAHDDISQIAVLAMHEALRNYDPAKGGFGQYVDISIHGYVRRAYSVGLYIKSAGFAQTYGSLIRVATRENGGFHKIDAYSRGLKGQAWGELTSKALKAETDFTDEEIAEYFAYNYTLTPLSEAPEIEKIVDVDPENEMEAVEASSLWDNVEPWLEPRDKIILHMREVLGITWAEIGQELGVGQARACQIRAEAIKKVRSNPAVAHALDLPTICNPGFRYKDKWKSSQPYPGPSAFPTPQQIREQNGINYQRFKPPLNSKQIKWLPRALQDEAARQ